MPTFTVGAVSPQVRDWSSKDGNQFKEYKVHLRDGDTLHTAVSWSRKASSPAPEKGQVLEGNLEETQFGKKFKATPKAFGGGGARGRDPKERAEIRRQNAHSQALRWLEFKYDPKAVNEDELHYWINWFYKDSGGAA